MSEKHSEEYEEYLDMRTADLMNAMYVWDRERHGCWVSDVALTILAEIVGGTPLSDTPVLGLTMIELKPNRAKQLPRVWFVYNPDYWGGWDIRPGAMVSKQTYDRIRQEYDGKLQLLHDSFIVYADERVFDSGLSFDRGHSYSNLYDALRHYLEFVIQERLPDDGNPPAA